MFHKSENIDISKFVKTLSTYNDTLSIGDIATLLNMSKEGIRKKIQKKMIKSARYNKKFVIAKKWLLDYVKVYGFGKRGSLNQKNERITKVLEFCETPRTSREIMQYIGIKQKSYFQKVITRPLLKTGLLQMTLPNSLHDNRQKYIAVK